MPIYKVATSNSFACLEIPQVKIRQEVEQLKVPTPTYTPPTLKKRLYAPPTEELSFAMGLWRFTVLVIATLSSLGKVEAAPCPKGIVPGYQGSSLVPDSPILTKEMIEQNVSKTYTSASWSSTSRQRMDAVLNRKLDKLPLLASCKVHVDKIDNQETLTVKASEMNSPIMRGTLETGEEFVAVKIMDISSGKISTQVFHLPAGRPWDAYWTTSSGPLFGSGPFGIVRFETLGELFHGYDVRVNDHHATGYLRIFRLVC